MYLPINLNLEKWYLKTLSNFLLPDLSQVVYSYNANWFDHVSHLEMVGRTNIRSFSPFQTASGWIVGDTLLFNSQFKLRRDEGIIAHETQNMDGNRIVTVLDAEENKICMYVRDALTGDVLYSRDFAYDSEGLGRFFSSPRQHSFGFYDCSKQRFLIFDYMNEKESSLTMKEFRSDYTHTDTAGRNFRLDVPEYSQIKWISTPMKPALSFVWRNSIVYRIPTDLEPRLVQSTFDIYTCPGHSGHPPLLLSRPSEGNRGSGLVWKCVR